MSLVTAPHELGMAAFQRQRCVNSLAEVHRRLAATVAHSDVWASDGSAPPTRWTAFHSGCTVGNARRVHGRAIAMKGLTHAAAAALTVLARGPRPGDRPLPAPLSPDRFDEGVDESFTAMANSGDPDGFAVLVRAWHEQADALDSLDRADLPPETERDSLRLSEDFDGWWNGECNLPPANGALLNELLERGVGRYLQARRAGDR